MKPIFAFSGQGAQTVGMGADLYNADPAAKAIFDEADRTLGYPLTEIIFNGPEDQLTQTKYCQVAIYTMSCACLDAFRAAHPEVIPFAAAGLSLGEYAALYAGKSYSFANGLRLLNRRALLMDEACHAAVGTMASVLGGDPAIIREVCKDCDIDVANYNSPGQVVISGEKDKVGHAIEMLKAHGQKKVIPLTVAGAFHSRLMRTAGEGLAKVLAETALEMPKIPVYHNFTSEPAENTDAIKENLHAQVAGSVQWCQSVQKMVERGADFMIEFGPGNVLTNLLRRTCPEIGYRNINNIETLNNFDKE